MHRLSGLPTLCSMSQSTVYMSLPVVAGQDTWQHTSPPLGTSLEIRGSSGRRRWYSRVRDQCHPTTAARRVIGSGVRVQVKPRRNHNMFYNIRSPLGLAEHPVAVKSLWIHSYKSPHSRVAADNDTAAWNYRLHLQGCSCDPSVLSMRTKYAVRVRLPTGVLQGQPEPEYSQPGSAAV